MKSLVIEGARACVRATGSIALVAVLATGVFFSETAPAEAGAYAIAKRYVGLHEKKHTRKLSRTVGVNPRHTPWCGAFVGAVMKKAGKPVPAGHMRAASWKRAGKPVSLKQARKGDVVVVRTKYGNHVGLYAGRKKGRVLLLGGNQSNQVKISGYRLGSVQAVRRM